MVRPSTAACAAMIAGVLAGPPARAHAIAGARVFPVTLTIDDPGVADEASLPTFTWQRSGATDNFGVGFEYDKRITEDTALILNDGLVVAATAHDKTRVGWNDVVITGKWQVYVNGPHEFLLSLGIIREIGRTGTQHLGADEYGSTTPTVYFGKGLGDLPIGDARAFAVTGEAGYTIADRELKAVVPPPLSLPNPTVPSMVFNNGYANRWTGGMSVQYSIPYLLSQVRDVPMPAFLRHCIPIVELAWSSPAASPSNLGTQLVAAPGVIWLGSTFQVGVEALVPGNRASGTHIGVITQFHLFFDDLLPGSLGRPLF